MLPRQTFSFVHLSEPSFSEQILFIGFINVKEILSYWVLSFLQNKITPQVCHLSFVKIICSLSRSADSFIRLLRIRIIVRLLLVGLILDCLALRIIILRLRFLIIGLFRIDEVSEPPSCDNLLGWNATTHYNSINNISTITYLP